MDKSDRMEDMVEGTIAVDTVIEEEDKVFYIVVVDMVFDESAKV